MSWISIAWPWMCLAAVIFIAVVLWAMADYRRKDFRRQEWLAFRRASSQLDYLYRQTLRRMR